MSLADSVVPTVGRPGVAVPIGIRPLLDAAGPLLGLVGIIGARWWATRAGLDPLAVGLAFGLALAALAMERPGNPRSGAVTATARSVTIDWLRPVAAGGLVGLALVGLVAAGAALGGGAWIAGLGRPAAPFLPWAAITILVASTEEALLRGRLFDAIRHAGGMGAALAVTTVAFALMHVPLYGWGVVPLDLAVGLGLGGLRLATGRVAAPAAAHIVADLATWWL